MPRFHSLPALLAALGASLGLLVAPPAAWSAEATETGPRVLPVKRPTRDNPVEFAREVLPFLRDNCLACHNRTKAKADLILESAADMLRGGESGPAVIPGRAAESLLFKVSTHEAKPRMPPADNKANARNLTAEELGLLALWIDQGARGSDRAAEAVDWQGIDPRFQASYSVALSDDGQYAAGGRANRLFLYHLPSGRQVAELADPATATAGRTAAAHQDVVNALAFSPDGASLASGGFRDLKLWRRVPAKPAPAAASTNPAPAPAPSAAYSTTRRVTLETNGLAVLRGNDGKPVAELRGSRSQRLRRDAAELDLRGLRQRQTAFQAALDAALKEQTAQQERRQKAGDALAAARKPWQDAAQADARVRSRLALATGRWERLQSGPTNTPAASEALKAAAKERDDATQAAREAEANLTRTRRAWDNAENELQLADLSLARARFRVQQARWNQREAGAALGAAETRLASLKEESSRPGPPTLSAAVSPDQRLAVTLDAAGAVRLWNADDGFPLDETVVAGARTVGFADPVTVSVSTESQTLHWAFLGRWELAHVIGADPVQSPLVDRVNALAYSRDGRLLASGSGEPSRSGEIRVWDAENASARFALTNLHSDAVLALAWSPDGRWLASGGADRFVRLVDTATGRPARALEGHTGHVLGVAWSTGGLALASSGADLMVKFWDVASGERRKQATGFTKEVVGVGWLADGNVAAAAGDPLLRLVNEAGEKVRDLPAGKEFLNALAVTPAGHRLAAAGQDGVLRVWRPDREPPLAEFAPPAVAGPTAAAR